MAAHRYWRALSFEAYGFAGLELSEFHLLAGGARIDSTAALTSNIAPDVGALSNLQDDVLSSGAAWPARVVSSLVLAWDAGAGGGMDVSDIRLGAASDPVKFPLVVRLQYSDDAATWTDLFTLAGISWPGMRQKTDSFDPTNAWSRTDRIQSSSTLSADQSTLGTGSATSGKGLVYKSAGKVQFEVTMTSLVSGADFGIGVGTAAADVSRYPGASAGSFAYNRNGNTYLAGAAAGYGATFTTGDVVGVVVDFSTGSLTFYKNGVSQGVASPTGMLGLALTPMAGTSSGTTAISTATLRGTGFLYPVAGASPWSGIPLIRRNLVAGRSSTVEFWSVATAASVARPTRTLEVPSARGRNDYLTGVLGKGIGRVRGFTLDYVNPLNKPYPCRVRLVRETDGLVVREQWSKADGSYDFQYVDELQGYTVLAYYEAHAKRAVVADGLTLANGKVELMA